MLLLVLLGSALPLRITCLAASPADARVAFGMSDGSVRVVDAPTGRVERTLTAPGGSVARLAWSPDGARLAAGLFPVPTRRHAEDVPSSGWTSIATRATWTVWDVASGDGLLTHAERDPSREEPALAWSAQGVLATWGGGEGVSVFRFDRRGFVERLDLVAAERSAVARWSVDGAHLFTVSPRGALATWDVDERRVVARCETHLFRPRALATTADGSTLLAGSDDVRLGAWCADGLAPRWQRRIAVQDLLNDEDAVASIAAHPREPWAAAAVSTWVGAELFDVLDGDARWAESYDAGDNTRFCCRFSPSGARLATWGTCDGESNAVREPRTGRALRALVERPMPGEGGLAWTSDERFLVVVEEWGRHVSVFDADGAALLRRDRFEEY